MRVGVDVDDVIYPWSDRAHALCEEAGITNGKTWTCWTPWVDYGCSKHEWLAVLSKATLNGDLYDEPPIEGTGEQLRRLLYADHTIHLVTARGQFINGPVIMRDTVDWLTVWGIPYTTLTFAKDKTVVPTDWFVDDRIENYDELALRPEGGRTDCRPVLVNRPHNQVAGYCHRRRVDTLEQFVDLVLKQGACL